MIRKGWLLFSAIPVFWGIPYLFIKIAVRELDRQWWYSLESGLRPPLWYPWRLTATCGDDCAADGS
jgi:hypothetical protein